MKTMYKKSPYNLTQQVVVNERAIQNNWICVGKCYCKAQQSSEV